jgi:hypothetical protein
MIKVSYNIKNTLVEGYYPCDINYQNIPEPWILIKDNEQILDKQMCVLNGKYQVYVESLSVQLQKAKDEKLAQLEAFILAKKTEKYTSHLAPEIIDGSGAEVKFFWHVDSIPNSNLTPESVLNKCTMDYVSCLDYAKKNSTDYASEKTIYDNCIKQKIVPYPTKIIKDGKEQVGVVNIFPVAFSIADHIQNREINNNKLFKIKEIQINACKSVEEVESIKFEG